MSGLFEIAIGAVLFIVGVRVLLQSDLVVMGYQVGMTAYDKPLGIFLCLVGLLWVSIGLRKKRD